MRRSIVCGLVLVAVLAAVSVGDPPPSAAVVPCPKMDPSLTTDRVLWNSGLQEVSGIQASIDHPGVLWVIQDSGNGPYLHAFSVDGDRLATYALTGTGVKNVDWEAIGLDHRTAADLLVIGDIGDNRENRNGIARATPALYVLREPALQAAQAPAVTASLSGIARYPFRYYDDAGSNVWKPRDAESLFVDPRTHNVFILWKHLATLAGAAKRSRVFELPDQDLATGRQNRAVHVADVIGAGPNVGTGPVAADIAADGEWIVVKNYSEGFLWRRARARQWQRRWPHPWPLRARWPLTLPNRSPSPTTTPAFGWGFSPSVRTPPEALHCMRFSEPGCDRASKGSRSRLRGRCRNLSRCLSWAPVMGEHDPPRTMDGR